MIKLLGISGSPRHGNTEILVKEALKAAEELPDVETEFVSLADVRIDGGCKATYGCWKYFQRKKEAKCVDYADDVNKVFEKIRKADGLIVGTPVYWGSVPAQFKALIDRSMSLEIADFALRNKVGGAIAVAVEREGGHESAISTIHFWFFTHDMIVCGVGPERPPTSIGGLTGAMAVQGFPYPVHSLEPGERSAVKKDEIGMAASRFLGKRVAELTKIVKAGLQHVPNEELGWPKFAKTTSG